MTLSTVSITNRDLASIKSSPRPILISLLLNYVVMGGIMLLMARWLINDSEIWAGFVTLAAMPPAITVTPFSYMLGGDPVFPLFGTTGLYLAALGLTPGMMVLLLGADFVNPARLLLILVQLIVIPLAVSRLLLSRGLAQSVFKWRDTAINWIFFITIYIIIGLNRQVFFEQPSILFGVIIITIVLTFGLGHAINLIARRLNIDRSTRISWMLMGTKKNISLASVIALTFLGEKAAFPAAIIAVFDISTIIWWGFYFKETGQVNL
jgi:BASS family bile acid:Na+ symporter